MALTADYRDVGRPKLDYFALMNGLKYGKTAKARLIALELILSERRDDPARVFNGIAYRLSSQSEAEKFANYDVLVKSGKADYEEVLLDLALGA